MGHHHHGDDCGHHFGHAGRFVFFGGGKRRAEVERFLETRAERPSAAVELHDYVDTDQLELHLASADVHLVSLRPEWDGTMVPSKLQGVFAVGRTVIFIGSETSSIGQWVIESGAGWVVKPGDLEGLQQVISEASHKEERDRRGGLARSYGIDYFSGNKNPQGVADEFISDPCDRSQSS